MESRFYDFIADLWGHSIQNSRLRLHRLWKYIQICICLRPGYQLSSHHYIMCCQDSGSSGARDLYLASHSLCAVQHSGDNKACYTLVVRMWQYWELTAIIVVKSYTFRHDEILRTDNFNLIKSHTFRHDKKLKIILLLNTKQHALLIVFISGYF